MSNSPEAEEIISVKLAKFDDGSFIGYIEEPEKYEHIVVQGESYHDCLHGLGTSVYCLDEYLKQVEDAKS